MIMMLAYGPNRALMTQSSLKLAQTPDQEVNICKKNKWSEKQLLLLLIYSHLLRPLLEYICHT